MTRYRAARYADDLAAADGALAAAQEAHSKALDRLDPAYRGLLAELQAMAAAVGAERAASVQRARLNDTGAVSSIRALENIQRYQRLRALPRRGSA